MLKGMSLGIFYGTLVGLEGCFNPIYTPSIQCIEIYLNLIKSEFTPSSWFFIELTELIKVHTLWRSNLNTCGLRFFIIVRSPVHYLNTCGLRFLIIVGSQVHYIKQSDFNFLGKIFNPCCWVSKQVY